jgi:hypothetical protein
VTKPFLADGRIYIIFYGKWYEFPTYAEAYEFYDENRR